MYTFTCGRSRLTVSIMDFGLGRWSMDFSDQFECFETSSTVSAELGMT